jgi:hypothetical protein|tara:strand:+ start:43 stop:270 length:228 start_codon:yes stop_codon:yes gene_type:complete
MSNLSKLERYVEDNRVPNSEIVYSSKGAKESGYFLTSKAAEIASTLYMGTHTFKDEENEIAEIWFFGKSVTFKEV